MAKKLTQLLCLMLAICMAFTMVSCRDTKTPSGDTSSTPAEAPVGDASDIIDIPTDSWVDNTWIPEYPSGDGFLDGDLLPEETLPNDEIVGDDLIGGDGEGVGEYIVLPTTEYSTQSPDNVDGNEMEGMEEIEEEPGSDRFTATSLIQK